jgi:hypothetical protein
MNSLLEALKKKKKKAKALRGVEMPALPWWAAEGNIKG